MKEEEIKNMEEEETLDQQTENESNVISDSVTDEIEESSK